MSLVGDAALWRGTAVIDSFEGVVSVAPTWESCGAVAITIRGNWTSPPSWSAYVELVCDRGHERPPDGRK